MTEPKDNQLHRRPERSPKAKGKLLFKKGCLSPVWNFTVVFPIWKLKQTHQTHTHTHTHTRTHTIK